MKDYPFPIPTKRKNDCLPTWTGSCFLLAGEHVHVLEYSDNLEGWNDDLTTLHEEATGTEHPIDVASRSLCLSLLEASMRGGEQRRLLEVGVGDGSMLLALRQAFPHLFCIGADVTRDHLHALAARYPDIPLLRFDLLQCPLPTGELDVVVCRNVLEHIRDDGSALGQLYRILKPGGLAAIEVPAGPWLYDDYDRELLHFRRYTMRALRAKVTKAGFRILKATHLGFLVFPAFAAVKLRNRLKTRLDKRHASHAGQCRVVATQARKTAHSRMLRMAFAVESQLGRRVCWPWGIRCVLLAEKPASDARTT